MDKCIICGKESDDMLAFQISQDFTLCICDDCLDYLQKGGKVARVVPVVDAYGEELNKAIAEWFEYKKSRKEEYTDKGKQSLMTRICNEVKDTSETIVAKKIRISMQQKWQGIAWEVGTIPTETIEKYFNSTFALCKNTEGKAQAQRKYASLFKRFDDEEQARERAAKIYKAFKNYVDNLKDEKYCKTFSRWLDAEIPTEWWK